METSAQLSDLDRRIIRELQGGLSDSRYPYRDAANRLDISTKELLDRLKSWKKEGVLRKMGAVLDQRKMGLGGNVMCVWNVPDDQAESFGEVARNFPEVTHCYVRIRPEGWKYNMYTMVHATDDDACQQVIDRLAEATGVSDFQLLFTEKELKKSSMQYF